MTAVHGLKPLREFANPEALATALAAAVAAALRHRLAAQPLATQPVAALAVSGGTTPTRFFVALRSEELDWSRVIITLVDDRCVSETSSRSNARLVRQTLLQNRAAAAAFLPLATADEGSLAVLPLPFAAVVLGMGLDGHTASFFPGGDRLSFALHGPHMLERINAPQAGEPRVTLTWAALQTAHYLALHIEGAGKRAVLDAALAPGPVLDMPVRVALARTPPADIFWCP
ncbi:MAG: 6-phosphogluconolactonase [Acidocella sp.]|nr:6-phosphogluconolactonase [Acidocella sp.]